MNSRLPTLESLYRCTTDRQKLLMQENPNPLQRLNNIRKHIASSLYLEICSNIQLISVETLTCTPLLNDQESYTCHTALINTENTTDSDKRNISTFVTQRGFTIQNLQDGQIAVRLRD